MALRMNTKDAPAAEAGAVVLCRWMSEDRIPRHHREYVRRHVDRLAKENGLGPIRLRWFRVTTSQPTIERLEDGRVTDVWGVSDKPDGNGDCFWGIAPFAGAMPSGIAPDDQPNTIGMHADLRGDQVPTVIAHEIRHLVQRRDALPEDESDADAYGAAYQRRANVA